MNIRRRPLGLALLAVVAAVDPLPPTIFDTTNRASAIAAASGPWQFAPSASTARIGLPAGTVGTGMDNRADAFAGDSTNPDYVYASSSASSPALATSTSTATAVSVPALSGVAIDGSLAVAVGQNGSVVSSSNAGVNWQLDHPLANTLQAVEFADSDHVWAAGTDGDLYQSTDGGQSWSAETVRNAQNTYVVDGYGLAFPGGTTGYLAGDSSGAGAIFATTDGGSTWNPLALPVAADRWTGIAFNGSGVGLAISPQGYIIRTTDGASWTVVENLGTELNSVGWGTDGTTAVAVGANGLILRSTDSGQTWSNVAAPAGTDSAAQFDDVAFVPGSSGTGELVGADNGSLIATSDDDGATWTSFIRSTGGPTLSGVACSQTICLAVANLNLIYRWSTGLGTGGTPTATSTPTATALATVATPTPTATSSPGTGTQRVAVVTGAATSVNVSVGSTRVLVSLPSGEPIATLAFSGLTTIPTTPLQTTESAVPGASVAISAYDAQQNPITTGLTAPVTIRIAFSPGGLNPALARIYTVDPSGDSQALETTVTANGDGTFTASAQTTHFSPFVVYAPRPGAPLPLVYIPVVSR